MDVEGIQPLQDDNHHDKQHHNAPNDDLSVSHFLKKNKLEHVKTIFESRDITIDELIEFSQNDLDEFAQSDLKLDTLSKTRFIKGIQAIKQSNNNNKQSKRVVVSTDEVNAIQSLYEKYDAVNKLKDELNIILAKDLELSLNTTNKHINTTFNDLINKLTLKKDELLKNIDDMLINKTNILSKQQLSLNEYLPLLKNAQIDYNSYMTNNNISSIKRKGLILKMSDNVLNKQNISLVLMTKPAIQFNNYMNNLNALYSSTFNIKDCDTPRRIIIYKIDKILMDQITIQYKLDKFDSNMNVPNRIKQIDIEWTKISDKYMDPDDDNKMGPDVDKYKWIKNDKLIEYKYKNKKRKEEGVGKYKIMNLKDDQCYAIRVRGLNVSGYGSYSKIKYVKTKKRPKMDYFSLFDSSKYTLSNKGRCLTAKGGTCNGHLLFGKYGINKGIYKWYIKCIASVYCYCSIGIKSLRDKSMIYQQQRINNSSGYTYYWDGLNSGWNPNETIKIELNCNKWVVSFYRKGTNQTIITRGRRRGRGKRRSGRGKRKSKRLPVINPYVNNGEWILLKTEKVRKRKKYYLAFECCDSAGNTFQLMKEKECE